MELILVRHADAEPREQAARDFDRRLTEKGREQAEAAGRCIERLGLAPDQILTSPLVRARETAELLQNHLAAPGGVYEAEGLSCGMAPSDLPEILRVAPEAETVILVGHEPDFSGLAEWLLGVSGGAVEVKKSAIAVFDLAAPRRSAGCLRALIPPKTFR